MIGIKAFLPSKTGLIDFAIQTDITIATNINSKLDRIPATDFIKHDPVNS
jgi:hypothetical protein